ncbi:MAG: FliM/FliN family flagellar motor switch protein [Terriglobia bacterium]
MKTIPELGAGAEKYLALWTQNIAEGLARLAGASVEVEPVEPQAGGAPEAGLWIRLFGGKAGEQAFFVAESDALRVGKLLLGSASGEMTTLSPEGRESVVQFFEQIATMIPMADLLGFGCELEVSAAERPVWESAGEAAFHFFTAQDSWLSLRALLSSDFLSALESAPQAAAASQVAEAAKTAEKRPDERPEKKSGKKLAEGPARSSSPEDSRDINLELLMDVELEVTLRFGQREMLLGDVLKLAPGSVVELDQEVQDPVELLVGSKVIAWGEVVTVDGSYGLRITGLASREERLESLRK